MNFQHLLRILFFAIVFFLIGLVSAYYYYLGGENGIVHRGFLPGLIFIIVVGIQIIITTRINYWMLATYIIGMYFTYLVVYYVTMITGGLGFITGIISTGYGAFTTFWLTNKYVVRINYDPLKVFVLGGIAFLINEIFLFPPFKAYITPYYFIDANLNTMFAGAFLLWQLFVGTALCNAILESKGFDT